MTAQLNWIDKAINWIAPQRALKRFGARMALDTLSKNGGERSFEALSSNRLRGEWTSLTTDADSANTASLEGLRNRIRELSRNNGIVAGPLKRISNNVIGRGIRPQSMVIEDGEFDRPNLVSPFYSEITKPIADRFNYQTEKYWERWAKKSDAQLRMNFYRQCWLAFRAMLSDGEVLVVGRSDDNPNHRRTIPFCLEIIEIDRLSTPTEEISNPQIRNGIEFDESGVPIRYHVLKKHPGTNFLTRTSSRDFEQIDAYGSNGLKKVFHLYDILRPGQSRGYSPFAACLKDIQDADRYIEAFIVGARIDACLAAFIESPVAYQQYGSLATNAEGDKIDRFEPGMIKRLGNGEKITVHDPKRVNNQFRDFISTMMMQMANAIDCPYEVFANDWKDLNYSNARTVLLQAYLAFRMYQEMIISDLCIPVWENVISDFVMKGLVEAPGFADRRDDYFRSAWISPGWAWVDPVKEADGKRIEVENNFDTLTNIHASKGLDTDALLEQRAKELKKIKDLETKYEVVMTAASKNTSTNGNEQNQGGDGN